MTRLRWLAPLVVLGLVVAACASTTASTTPQASPVVPPALHSPVAAIVLAGGQAPGRVEQEALASMLESGDFDRDLRHLREALAASGESSMVTGSVTSARTRAAFSGWVTPTGMRLRNRP